MTTLLAPVNLTERSMTLYTTQGLAKPVAMKATAGKDKDPVVLFGGTGGGAFDDWPHLIVPGSTVKQILIRSGTVVDAIQLVLNNPQDPGGTYSTGLHGGGGGNLASLTLSPGELIVSVDASWGTYGALTVIHSIKFVTNLGNTLAGGTPGNIGVGTFTGTNIIGFAGQSGVFVDALNTGYIDAP